MVLWLMDKTTLYLTPDLSRRLRELALREGRSQAEIIREAIGQYLNGQDEPPLRSVGVAEYGKLSADKVDGWLEENWRPA